MKTMKKTDSFQVIARTMVKVAWDGKAVIRTKSGSDTREERKTLNFTLVIPKNEGQTVKDAAGNVDTVTWTAFGTTNEVWKSFLDGKLIPVIREALTQAVIRETSLHGAHVGDLVQNILVEKVSPADVKGPYGVAHRLACALSPRGNWLACDGEAHSNPFIDNCGLCMPNWGWVKVPVGIHTWTEYRMRRERENDAATWKE